MGRRGREREGVVYVAPHLNRLITTIGTTMMHSVMMNQVYGSEDARMLMVVLSVCAWERGDSVII